MNFNFPFKSGNKPDENKPDMSGIIPIERKRTEDRIAGPNGSSLDIGYYKAQNNQQYGKVEYDIEQMERTFSTRFQELIIECGNPEIAFERFVAECTIAKEQATPETSEIQESGISKK